LERCHLKPTTWAAGADVVVTADWAEALAHDALVLPGVGAFGQAAGALPPDRGPVLEALEAGLPCLGICLGMQLLFADSEEAEGAGIGLIEGRVRLLDAPIVPQMGWNDVETTDDPLFEGASNLVAYYANSYVCVPERPDCAIAWSEYAGRRFVAAVRLGSVWGVQFHPEKSSDAGRRIIANFVGLVAGTQEGELATGSARRRDVTSPVASPPPRRGARR
jgi:glutamine amidotransferase